MVDVGVLVFVGEFVEVWVCVGDGVGVIDDVAVFDGVLDLETVEEGD